MRLGSETPGSARRGGRRGAGELGLERLKMVRRRSSCRHRDKGAWGEGRESQLSGGSNQRRVRKEPGGARRAVPASFGRRQEKWLGVVDERGGRWLRWLVGLDGSDLGGSRERVAAALG